MSARLDHRADPGAWAHELGVSREAVDVYLASDVIDLHVNSFIWHRLLGRDPTTRHDPWFPLRGFFLGHADLPRLREAAVGGAAWIITTNPLRDGAERVATFLANVDEITRLFAGHPDEVALVTTAAEYRAARARGLHGAFIGVQGGNALDVDPSVLDRLAPGTLLLVTLVHLSSSPVGTTSSPLGLLSPGGLGPTGIELVHALDARRIFVDLAHASPKAFWDAVAAHDASLPLMVSHTGVTGAHRHWRNLDDQQIRAVAHTGGVVGILFHAPFLGDPLFAGRVASVARHLEHLVRVGGSDIAALGSDWDGSIVTPRDMPTCLELPRLVEALLERRMPVDTIVRILGRNFLRALADLRG